MPRLTIIGLGLIGGSIGLAVKETAVEGLDVAGTDIEPGVAARARKAGAIDADERRLDRAVEGARIVVVATPISEMRAVFEAIAPSLAEGAVVTDVASTKRDVMRWAAETLPEHVDFVGGHPIGGKEQQGIDAAEASLFRGRPWAMVPATEASERAVRAVENLVQITGAQPLIIDAAEHDAYLAAVSHLPLVAATALFSLVRNSQAWEELGALAGPGFRDTTRLASGSPDLGHDIALTNRDNLLHWLDRYIEELRRYREMLTTDEALTKLSEALARAQLERDTFLQSPPSRPRLESTHDTMSAGERMVTLLMGEYVVRRTKEIEKMLEERGGDEPPRRRR